MPDPLLRLVSIGIGLLLVLLAAACTTGPPVGPARLADMDIVARDDHFTLVRLRAHQDLGDLARAFLGSRSEVWQIEEVNTGSPGSGDLVAVPAKPANITGVYQNEYRTLPILCYHQFTEGTPEQKLELREQDFEAQLRYLRDEGYRMLSFAEVAEIMQNKKPLPEKAVVLTIDDGYDSVYDIAWPLLKKYDAKATLFIYTDFVGAGAALSWAELREMRDSGLVEIESHGKSHASLAPLPGDADTASYETRLAAELSASEAAFMAKLGAPPQFLSYPYGNSSRTIANMLKSNGYQLAATVTRGQNSSFVDPFLLHRTMIYDSHSLDDFKKFLDNSRRRVSP
ncbi:MAG: polysaccharide deacetylase family protein [Congregibacter sp.]